MEATECVTGFAFSSELYKTDLVWFGVIGHYVVRSGAEKFFLFMQKQKLFTYVLPIH